MKRIGLVGGIGPASTIAYYRGLIQESLARETPPRYPEIIIDSVDMRRHDAFLAGRDYDALADSLLESLSRLKAAGAEIAAITANAEHAAWSRIACRLPLPTVSIVSAAAKAMKRRHIRNVLVFGTEFTLRSALYEKALAPYGITAMTPSQEDIPILGRLIYPNLENGIIIPDDQAQILAMAKRCINACHPDALLLACTELALAVRQEDVPIPLMDTTQIHIKAIYQEASLP